MYRNTIDLTAKSIGTVLAVATVAAMGWAMFWPVTVESPISNGTSPAAPRTGEPVEESNRPVAIDGTWRKALRRESLILSQPESVAASTPLVENRLALELLGTIIEAGNSYAMVADALGNIDLQPEGGLLQIEPQGVRIERIDRRRVEVSYAGYRTALELKERQAVAEGPLLEPDRENSSQKNDGSHSPSRVADSEPRQFESLEDELDWLNGQVPDADVGETRVPATDSQGDR